MDDGCKEIVPTTDIKDFSIKLVSDDKIYWVRWKEAFYKAQIIFIKGELHLMRYLTFSYMTDASMSLARS